MYFTFTIAVGLLSLVYYIFNNLRIRQTTIDEAEANGIHGKAVTPYVLVRVAELTEGESRRTNTARLVNNARTAAQIAQALDTSEMDKIR